MYYESVLHYSYANMFMAELENLLEEWDFEV